MSALLLEPVSHTYLLDARTIVPGATEILSDLTDLSKANPQDVAVAKERGTNAHIATAFFDRDDLDEETVDAVTNELLDGYKRFRTETGFTPIEIERTYYHDRYGFATTIDRLGWLFGKLAIVELKATSIHNPVAALQTAAQLEACNHVRKAQGEKKLAVTRYACRLLPGRYDLQEHKNPNDLRVFLACLTRHAWRIENDKQINRQRFAAVTDPIFVRAGA